MAKSLQDLEEFLNREFGALPEPEELEERAERRSRVTLRDAPTAAPVTGAERPGLDYEFKAEIARPADDSFLGEDTLRNLGAGVLDVAEMATGIPEYAARQAGWEGGAEFFGGVRGGIAETREDILEGLSPEALDRVGREILTLDPNKSMWRGSPMEVAGGIWDMFFRTLPATLTLMVPGAMLFRAGASGGAIATMAASEAGLSVGAIANNVTDEINAMDSATLMKESPRYASLIEQGMDEESARFALIQEAQGAAPIIGGAMVGAMSLATGRILKPVFSKAEMLDPDVPLGLGGRTARGFGYEAIQEGGQGASERIMENVAAKIYDENRHLMAGVGEAAAMEGFIGGLTGGAVAGVAGTRPQPPLPPPEEGPGGQLGLPGIGPAEPAPPVEEGPAPEGRYPFMGAGKQLDLIPESDVRDPVLAPDVGRTLPGTEEEVMGPTGEQQTLPLGIAGTVPLRERGPGRRRLAPDEIPPRQEALPDDLDQPTAEPVGDIEAQLADMDKTGGRQAVYLSPEQRNIPRKLPKGVKVIPNYDGKGGTLIVKTAAGANKAAKLKKQVQEGTMTMQEAIGEMTLAGKGKPADGNYVVQLRDEAGNVARESMVATQSEALKLKNKWGKGAVIVTPSAALQRREALQQDELRTEDPAAVAEAQEDLFEPSPQPLTAAEQARGEVEGFNVEVRDQAGELLGVEEFDSQEEAESRADVLSKTSPDQWSDSIREQLKGLGFLETYDGEEVNVQAVPRRARAEPKKAGLETTKKVPKREPKGPEEGPPKGMPREEAVEPTPEREQYTVTGTRTRKGKKEKFRETFETREEAVARQKELKKALGKAGTVDKKITVGVTRKPKKPSTRPADVSKKPSAVDISETADEFIDQIETAEEPDRETPIDLTKVDEFDETMSTKEIEKLPEYDVEYSVVTDEIQPDKTAKIIETRETKTYKTKAAANAAATRLTKKAQKDAGPDYKVKAAKIVARTTPELESVFASAVQARADREPGRTTEEFTQKNTTPSQKIQFIRREKAAQIRKKREARSLRKMAEVTAPGKKGPTEVQTKPLTYEKVPGAETKAEKVKRETRVKKARARLNKAVKAARLFFARFDKSGPIGQYLDQEKNVDGTLTEKGMKFAKAKEGAAELAKLADAVLADAENTSTAHAAMAEQVATALERLGKPGILPEVFAEEFAVVIEALETGLTRLTKTPTDERTRKILKDNAERANARKKSEQMREKWGNDPIFRDIIAPILRKFSEVTLTQTPTTTVPKAAAPRTTAPKYYKPGEFEITNLRVALRSFRKMTQKYPTDEWYAPLREILEYYGFRFDEAGDLIVEEFSPSDALLAPAFKERYGISATAAEGIDYTLKPGKVKKPKGELAEQIKQEKAEQLEKRKAAALERQKKGRPVQEEKFPRQPDVEQEATDERKAIREIRTANGLIRIFKDKIDSSKITIAGIQRAEQRLIRGLRKLGVWRDVSPTMGRIVITGGYKSKTIRLVGPRLAAKTLTRPKARDAVASLRPIPMPQKLVAAANRMVELDPVVDKFVDENEVEMFLEQTDPVGNNEKYLKGASALGDLLESGVTINGNLLLEQLAKNVDPDTFYGRVLNHLKNFDFGQITVKYGRDRDGLLGPTDFPTGAYGSYNPRTGILLLNRRALAETKADRVFGARVLHTITHEMLHAGMYYAVERSPGLKEAIISLRDIARAAYLRKFPGTKEKDMPYGLKLTKKDGTVNPRSYQEFLAEAFSDEALQAHLKATRFDVKDLTLWQRFVGLVQRVFNIDPSGVTTVWEALLLTEELLFEHAGETGAKNAEELLMQGHDGVLRGYAEHFKDRFLQSSNILQRVRDGGRNVIFNLTSMEQFAERFGADSFIGKFIRKYYSAFSQRNAKAAEYLKLPQGLSHRWSKAEAESPEEALTMSQVMSEATLLSIDPRVGLEDDANKHLGKSMQAKHKDLHARWNELSDSNKKLMNEILDYYQNSIDTETLFLMQSALRGVLTGGRGAALTEEEFEEKFTIDHLKTLKTRKDLKDALSEYMVEEGAEGMLDTIYKMSMLPRKRKGIYAPLMRYGDEVTYAEKQREDVLFEDHKEAMAKRAEIVVDDPTLDAQVFEDKEGNYVLRVWERAFIMGETVSEVQQLRQEMIDDPNNSFTREDFRGIQQRRSGETEAAIKSNDALHKIIRKLEGNPAAQAAMKNFYLRNLSDQAFRKHEVRRKNRLGVRYDTQHRNLALYAKQSAYHTAQLEFGHKMAAALRDMDEALKPIREDEVARPLSKAIEHLRDRDKLTHDLPDRSEFTKKSIEGTHFFMLASPSYWAINGSQPWMVTLPTLGARHGWMESAAQMWHFQKIIFGTLANEVLETRGGLFALKKGQRARVEQTFNIVDQIEEKLKAHFGADAQQYIDMLEYLRKNHIIDINVFNEMRDVAAGKKQSAWDRTIDASRIMAHITEVNNRAVSALAAYQLELNKTGDSEAAVQYAGKIVSHTQFNYSAENKPPVFQKYPLLFQFMQWPQHMYAHLIRNYQGMVEAGVMNKSEARSALLGLLGTHAAVGGIAGMMLQPIKFAIGLVMLAFGDEDEPYTFANALSGRTFDRLVAEVAADLFGTTASSIITKGLPMAAGVDLSARMSMGTLYFVDLRGDNAESVLGSIVASFGGATLNQGLKFATGAGKIMDGDVYRGVETMMPKIFRDGLRAGRYYNEGLVNNAGDTVIEADEMSTWNVIAQAFGFQPAKVSQHYTAQQAMKDVEQHLVGRRGELMRLFRIADSQAERRDVMREIRAFNLRNPQERISPSQLRRNIRAQRQREQRYRRYGANISERKARAYQKYGEPYRDE